jgi:hypothetical protein
MSSILKFTSLQAVSLSKPQASLLRGMPEPPHDWGILSEADQAQYLQLRKFLSVFSFRTSQDDVCTKFRITIKKIQKYTTRNDADDWKRQWVCGLVVLDCAIAISTHQLSKLLGRCKASINTGFQLLGYDRVSLSSFHASDLVRAFPSFARNCRKVRQWTIRVNRMTWRPPLVAIPSRAVIQLESPALTPDPLVSWAERSEVDSDGVTWQDELFSGDDIFSEFV